MPALAGSDQSTAVISVVHEDATGLPKEFFVRAVKQMDLQPATAGDQIQPRKLCLYSCGDELLRAIVVELYIDKTINELTSNIYGMEKLYAQMAKFHLDNMKGNENVPRRVLPAVPRAAVAVNSTASTSTASNSSSNTRMEESISSDDDSFEDVPRPPIRPLIGRFSAVSPGPIRRKPAVPTKFGQMMGNTDARAQSMPRFRSTNLARIPLNPTPSTSTALDSLGVGKRDTRTPSRYMPYDYLPSAVAANRNSRAKSVAPRFERESSVASMVGRGGRSMSVVSNGTARRRQRYHAPPATYTAPIPDVMQGKTGENISSGALQVMLARDFSDNLPADKAWQGPLRHGISLLFTDKDLVAYGYTERGKGDVTSDNARAHLARIGHLYSVLGKVCEQRGSPAPDSRQFNQYLSSIVGWRRAAVKGRGKPPSYEI